MSEKFVKMEIDICDELTPNELALYYWIKRVEFMQRKGFICSQSFIATKLNCSRRNVVRIMNSLREKGAIYTIEVVNDKGNFLHYYTNKIKDPCDTSGTPPCDTSDTHIIDSTIIDNTNYTKLKELEKYYLLCKNQHRDKVSDKLLIDTLETYGEETVLSIIDYYNRNYDATICKIYYMFKSERQVLRTLSDINKEKMKTKNKQNIKYTDEYIELLEKEVNKKC